MARKGCKRLKWEDMTGRQFGRFTVVSEGKKTRAGAFWVCRCECGTVRPVLIHSLLRGASNSCGCLVNEKTSARLLVDLTGQRFGRLLILKMRPERDQNKKVLYDALCDCGTKTVVIAGQLTGGYTASCGCLFVEQRTASTDAKRVDLTGLRFHRMTVLKMRPERSIHKKILYDVRCDCGTETVVIGEGLVSGQTKSCGCWKRDMASQNRIRENAERKAMWIARRAHWADLYGKDGLDGGALRQLRIELNGGQEPWDRHEIFARDAGICHLCTQPVIDDAWDIDHVHPIALGGQDNPRNVALSHTACNHAKSRTEYLGVRYCMECGPVGHPLAEHDDDYLIG